MKSQLLVAPYCVLQLVLTTFLGLFAPAMADEGKNQWELRPSDISCHNSGERILRIGDTVSILTRNLDGWLNRQIKYGYFNEEPFIKEDWPTFGNFISKCSNWDLLTSLAENDELTVLKSSLTANEIACIQPVLASFKKDHVPDPGARIAEVRGHYNAFLREQIANLHPIIDNVCFDDIAPLKSPEFLSTDGNFREKHGLEVTDTIFLITYDLARTDANSAKWQKLLGEFKFTKPVEFTLGLKLKQDSWLGIPIRNPDSGSKPILFRLVPRLRFIAALFIIAAALMLFIFLAGPTNLLRDTDAPMRPANNGALAYPVSLARSQMAFWFFLVAAAYLFIWLTTSRLDSITEQVLGLVGISSATALGVAFVSAGKGPSRTIAEEATRANDATLGEAERDAARRRGNRLIDQLERLKRYGPFMRLMDDWLAEDGSASFHRFQMLAWTSVLGLIFFFHVCGNYAMPEFSNTVLALMGISSGTYIGFKLPDVR